jgi:arginase
VDSWRAEIRSAFDLGRAVARAVQQSRAYAAFPLVLSGNCGPAAIGCVAGVDETPAVCWFDAHGDFNTPDTTIGGFLDGMAVATVTGRAWPQLTKAVDGFRPIDERTVVLIGTRDLDPLEAALLQGSRIRQVAPASVRADLGPALAAIAEARTTAYLHLDLDVLDPSEGRVNCYAAPGGLSRADVAWAIEQIGESFDIVAAAMTALDPASDPDHRALDAAVSLGVALVDRALRTR